MRTKTVLGIVLCFGLAFTMLSGSGIGAEIFGENPGEERSTSALDDAADGASVDEDDEDGGLESDVSGDDEPTLTGVAISGGFFAAELVGNVALLPVTLIGLGFPSYFAVAVGGLAQIVAFVGLIQFIRGTEYL